MASFHDLLAGFTEGIAERHHWDFWEKLVHLMQADPYSALKAAGGAFATIMFRPNRCRNGRPLVDSSCSVAAGGITCGPVLADCPMTSLRLKPAIYQTSDFRQREHSAFGAPEPFTTRHHLLRSSTPLRTRNLQTLPPRCHHSTQICPVTKGQASWLAG